jgi:plastocyanin
MSREPSSSTADANSTDRAWSRRTILKLTGGSMAVGGIAGVAGGFQDDDEDGGDGQGGDEGENGDDGEEEAGPDDSALVDDLIDPTWGYPLAADETESVDVENVVAMETMPGEGAHENFPLDMASGEALEFEFKFDPVGLHVEPGGVVHFFSAGGEHTATAYHEKYSNPEIELSTRLPEAVPGFSSPPVVEGESWLYQFHEEGIYDILCLPHLPLGMVMRVVVMESDEDGADDGTDDDSDDAEDGTDDDMQDDVFTPEPTEGLLPNVKRVFDAPELTPENIVEEGSVAWADLTLTEE